MTELADNGSRYFGAQSVHNNAVSSCRCVLLVFTTKGEAQLCALRIVFRVALRIDKVVNSLTAVSVHSGNVHRAAACDWPIASCQL